MSIFDPLGFLIPITIQARLLMQCIWSKEVQWDEVIPELEFKQWHEWLQVLEKIKTVKISRCYQLPNFQNNKAELHVFCDASSRAYGAVAYWRFDLGNGNFYITFIIAKNRVVPSKTNTTIPRLELQAALIAVRLAETIMAEHEFEVTRRVFWSDSKIVLSWINKDSNDFKIFVANRIQEIREKSKTYEWRWVSSENNAADDASKYRPSATENNSRWLLGPSFLYEHERFWEISTLSEEMENENEELQCVILRTSLIEDLIDFSRFSSWLRVISAVAMVLEAK
uniref:RNase H type-1 domain-containing protein n=1 Tax=Trichogramma kaykai TaxID=54128 RepID=A0ABD2XC02_9HYME